MLWTKKWYLDPLHADDTCYGMTYAIFLKTLFDLIFGVFSPFLVCFPESAQSTVSAPNEIQANQPQALHYALANAQQVQIHQIGEDGQVQVVCTHSV